MAEVAVGLGRPPQPWQRYVFDVAGELNKRGELQYREVVVVVGRQQGKTICAQAAMAHRALAFPAPQRIVYTSITRLAAVRKLQEVHFPMLQASPYRRLVQERRNTGSEAILWHNGSTQSVSAPTASIGHSESLDMAVIDEGWSHRNNSCELGLSPTMITTVSPQLWIPSAVGEDVPSDEAGWLRKKVEQGREHCEDPDTTTCYIEYSAPVGADYSDPDVWWDTLPGLGHVCTEEVIAHELATLGPATFCRSFLSQWPDEMAAIEWRTIAETDWRDSLAPESYMTGRGALGIAVEWDRSRSALAMVGASTLGGQHWQPLDHEPGTGWVVDRVIQRRRELSPCAVVLDPNGPAGSLMAPLTRAGVRVTPTSAGDLARATGDATDAIRTGGVRVCGDLTGAVTAAAAAVLLRPLADSWAWDRRSGPVAPLEACSLAAHGWLTKGHLASVAVVTA